MNKQHQIPIELNKQHQIPIEFNYALQYQTDTQPQIDFNHIDIQDSFVTFDQHQIPIEFNYALQYQNDTQSQIDFNRQDSFIFFDQHQIDFNHIQDSNYNSQSTNQFNNNLDPINRPQNLTKHSSEERLRKSKANMNHNIKLRNSIKCLKEVLNVKKGTSYYDTLCLGK